MECLRLEARYRATRSGSLRPYVRSSRGPDSPGRCAEPERHDARVARPKPTRKPEHPKE